MERYEHAQWVQSAHSKRATRRRATRCAGAARGSHEASGANRPFRVSAVRLAVHGSLRLALVALSASGSTLAAVTAVVAMRRDVGGVSGYAGAAVALALLAVFT